MTQSWKNQRTIIERRCFSAHVLAFSLIVVIVTLCRQSRQGFSKPITRARLRLSCDILEVRAGRCDLPPTPDGHDGAALLSKLMRYDDRCREQGCVVWVAYIGDSQLRSPFNHLVDVLLGQDFARERKQLNVSNHHIDQRVCCHMNPLQSTAPQSRMSNVDCTFTRAYQTASYVEQFFSQSNRTKSLCLTWQWSPMADHRLRHALAEYTFASTLGNDTRSNALLAPQMIVIDPGLHSIMSRVSTDQYVDDIKQLFEEMRRIAYLQQRASIVPTRFVYHDITSVVDAHIHAQKRALLNESLVVEFNSAANPAIQEALAFKDSRTWLRIFPAYRLTRYGRHNNLVSVRSDGIHYDGGYDAIVVESNLYFMHPNAAQCFAPCHYR